MSSRIKIKTNNKFEYALFYSADLDTIKRYVEMSGYDNFYKVPNSILYKHLLRDSKFILIPGMKESFILTFHPINSSIEKMRVDMDDLLTFITELYNEIQ